MKPDKNRVKDLLSNWRYWARDCDPDSAEIHYYTISPSFRDYVKPTPKFVRYDDDAAMAVELVLGEMFQTRPRERELLILYWICIPNVRDLADCLDMPKSTLHDKLRRSEDVFADCWRLLFYSG